jgi:hypothetical protein
MKQSFILAALLAFGIGLAPHAAAAQTTDQTTAAPMATATANPEGVTSPAATDTSGATDQTMGSTATTTTTTGGGGYWGLLGLVGLLGLMGMRNRTTIN